MIKKAPFIVCLITILLSACGGNTATESAPTPTSTLTELPPATATNTPGVSEIVAEPPTITATATIPIPTNVPGCTNSASFVVDVTIPDNSPVPGGTTFTKTWTVKNTGTCIWGPDYKLVHYSDENMGAPATVPLTVTYPGQTVDISVALAAPAALGSHRANFVIKNPAGLIMKIDADSRLWVLINVTETAASGGTVIPVTGGGSVTPAPSAGTASTTSGSAGSANAACAYTLDAVKVAAVINAINAYRAQNGISAYPVNDQLTQAAQAHANDMACNGLFGHSGSDGSTPQSRVAATGYVASSVTENVYGSYPPLSGQGAVTWWQNDKTDTRHNLNLISTKFTEIGVGYAFFNNFGYYVVVFAAP